MSCRRHELVGLLQRCHFDDSDVPSGCQLGKIPVSRIELPARHQYGFKLRAGGGFDFGDNCPYRLNLTVRHDRPRQGDV